MKTAYRVLVEAADHAPVARDADLPREPDRTLADVAREDCVVAGAVAADVIHVLAADDIETFLGLEETTRLSRAALETLAIVAYQEPITRPQVDAIRARAGKARLAQELGPVSEAAGAIREDKRA